MNATPVLHLPIAFALFALPAALHAQKVTNWSEYLGGSDSSHYSQLKQVNKGNVNQLELAWSYETGDDVSYTFCPLVVDNIAYVAAKQGALVALDATTGKELWIYRFPGGGRFSGIAGQRGANYWENKDRSDRRILVTSSGMLYSIRRAHGQAGRIFCRSRKARSEDRHRPRAYAAGLEDPGAHLREPDYPRQRDRGGLSAPPGDIRAFDVPTGKLRVGVPHDSASRRIRIWHLAERRVHLHGRRGCVG